MKKAAFSKKALALCLVLILLLPSVISCKARPLAQTKLASTVVGTVDKYSVLYEEYYFLAKNYYDAIKGDYKNDPQGLKAAVDKYVNENIVTNYAILKLCETEGLIYDEKELKDEVTKLIELSITSDFDDSRSTYLKSQKEMGLTDHYVRFVAGVDILYDRLATKYKESGVVPNTDEKLLDYIKKNFIHTWHIAIFVDEGESYEAERAKAEEALAKLNNGEMSMYELMGSKYNENLIPPSTSYDGYYFAKGSMETWYEDAAFVLDVGEHSEIVVGKGESNSGDYVQCFYIIERLESNEDEIRSNFNALSDEVGGSIISEKMESIKSSLHFTPNDFARSLDITALKAPKNGADVQLILVVILCILSCAFAVAMIIVIRKIRKKRFKSTLVKK